MNPEVLALATKAHRSLQAARRLFEGGDYDFAASRAYYAMFYMAEAALLARGQAYSRHGSVIAAFGREFVKSGEVPVEMHGHLRQAFDQRAIGDYRADVPFPRGQAENLLTIANAFLGAVEPLLRAPGGTEG